jgi:hypothetical protein
VQNGSTLLREAERGVDWFGARSLRVAKCFM